MTEVHLLNTLESMFIRRIRANINTPQIWQSAWGGTAGLNARVQHVWCGTPAILFDAILKETSAVSSWTLSGKKVNWLFCNQRVCSLLSWDSSSGKAYNSSLFWSLSDVSSFNLPNDVGIEPVNRQKAQSICCSWICTIQVNVVQYCKARLTKLPNPEGSSPAINGLPSTENSSRCDR